MADKLHVMPLEDLVEHEVHSDCVCGPTTEVVMRDDGSNGWIHVHHALDGRETETREANIEQGRKDVCYGEG